MTMLINCHQKYDKAYWHTMPADW